MNAHLLIKCMNPKCPHHFHLAEVENIEEHSPVPNEVMIVRLNRKTVRLLNTLSDSDTVEKVTQAMGQTYYTEERQGMTQLANIPFAKLHEVEAVINAVKASAGYSTNTEVSEVPANEVMADPTQLIDYTADSTLTTLENAQARKFHYESEIARMQAIKLSLNLKK